MRANKLGTRLAGVVLALLMVITIMPITSIKAKAADGVDGFVNRCYEVSLGRTGDAEGINYWINEINSKKRTGVDVVYNFIFSKEYEARNRSNTEFVTDLYTMFMGRTPDQDGYNYWCGQMEAGKSRKDIFTGFANSKEFYETCTNYGVTAGYYTDETDGGRLSALNLFVGRMYETTLGRLGDQEGQNYWTKGLMNGELTGTDCAIQFINSKEFVNLKLSNEDYVDKLYAAFMGRTPDAEGKNHWIKLLNEGDMTRDEVFACFANSAEFKGICQTYGITSYDYKAEEWSPTRKKEEYVNGKLAKYIEYYIEGENTGAPAIEKEYDDEGNMTYHAEYSYGDKKEYSVQYDDKGNVLQKGEWDYDDNGFNKTGKFYEANGSLKERYVHTRDNYPLVNKTEWYDGTGKLTSAQEYQYNDKEQETYYKITENGKLFHETISEYDSEYRLIKCTNIDYNDDGEVMALSYYENKYNKDGSYVEEDHYSGDETVGTRCYYDANGCSIREESYDENGKVIWYVINEYNEYCNQTKCSFYSNGELTSYTTYEYNAKGEMKKNTKYNADGSVEEEYIVITTYK